MLKYDHQLTEVKSRFPAANKVLIILPQNLNTDNLAAGLALYLSLKIAGKKVDIVSTGTPLVSHANLYGIGEVKNDVSKSGGGNFIISLDGVVDSTGTMQQVPALEKLDWYPEGSKLNLVFHVVPGQRFEPTNITSSHEQSGYDLTWVIGCASLNELGNLFISNSQYFAQSQVINVDINPLNSYFGFANVIDPQASSISEIIAQVLPSLTLSLDKDVASNIITGIYSATNNLTQKINPDTFMVVSQAVQVGGTLPATPIGNPVVQTSDTKPNDQLEIAPVQPESSAPTPTQPEQQVASQAPEFSAPVAQPNLQSSPFIVPPQDISFSMPTPQAPIASQYNPIPVQPDTQVPQAQSQPQFQFDQSFVPSGNAQAAPVTGIPQAQAQGFDLRQIFQIPQMPSSAQPANPDPINFNQSVQPQPVQTPAPQPVSTVDDSTPDAAKVSQEERPMGEYAHSSNPEMESTPTPDWLVPKIFKGGNLG